MVMLMLKTRTARKLLLRIILCFAAVIFLCISAMHLSGREPMQHAGGVAHHAPNSAAHVIRKDFHMMSSNGFRGVVLGEGGNAPKVSNSTGGTHRQIQQWEESSKLRVKPISGMAESKPSYEGYAADAWNRGDVRFSAFGSVIYNRGERNNFIPMERVVHFDLKGAPPLPSVFKKLIPWLAMIGATSILLEYEDMFPWEGWLTPLAAKNHYSKEDIKDILTLCREYNIGVIPLIPTFGHLEFALKLPQFSHLREVPHLPQVLCPSHPDSFELVKSMVSQVMKLHNDAKYIHIGCDEVYHIGKCDKCKLRERLNEHLFLDHVAKTARYVRSTYGIVPIIWHDMILHISSAILKRYNLGKLVEPMVWIYAEDVFKFVKPVQWSDLAQTFSNIWSASAFKGAYGEQSIVPNVRRHLINNMNWLDVMSSESHKFSGGFRGIALTGWQRHDHFAVLCELLPSSLPSLAVNLMAISYGFFNGTVYPKFYEVMNCMHPQYQTELDIDSDPYLWGTLSSCFFLGDAMFTLTSLIDTTKKDVASYIDRVTSQRAWITDYNRRHNFSSPMRIEEDLEELPLKLQSLTELTESIKEVLLEWYDMWTIGEWIEQQIWPLIESLQRLEKESLRMKLVNTWPARPLPLLLQLKQFDITGPDKISLREKEE